jgi:hypothetical protein
MSTWYDIKLATLQKLFAADGSTIPNDTSTKDYIASMPQAANEGLQRLSTAGKFIKKFIDIAHNPVTNRLGNTGKHIASMERGELTFEADGIRSLYFEYFGVGTATITVDGAEEPVTFALSSKQGYSEVRKLVDNPEDKHVVLKIESDFPIALKNIAMYTANFESDEEVQSYAEKVRYDLKELAPDFYMLDDSPIAYEGDLSTTRYENTSDFFQEGDKVLLLDRDTPGNFRIYYKAYPQEITSVTPDSTEMVLDPEVATLLPLYMASQLYKDDDNGIATTYRNEFEVAFEALRDSNVAPSAERFIVESGWL